MIVVPDTIKVLDLWIPGEPKAVQSVRSVKCGKFIRHYQPNAVVEWKNYIRLFVMQNLPDDFVTLDGPLAVFYEFVFSPPKSMSKKALARLEGGCPIYKITKPDLGDNLRKGLNDALTGVIWTDDSRIVIDAGNKRYGTNPGIQITVHKIKEGGGLMLDPKLKKYMEENAIDSRALSRREED